jgi:hypothetical protein
MIEADHRNPRKTAWYVYETSGMPSMAEVDEMYTEPSRRPLCFDGDFIPNVPVEVPNELSAHMGLKRYYVGDLQ